MFLKGLAMGGHIEPQRAQRAHDFFHVNTNSGASRVKVGVNIQRHNPASTVILNFFFFTP
jgi:hypothetical protein